MEVVTMVGGAVLSSLFQSLFDGLKSTEVVSYARESKVLDELKKWETMLTTIYSVLDYAEEQQRTNRLVKSWFNDLRDLAYDVEDVLDEFNAEAMRSKFRSNAKASTSKFRKLIPSSVVGLSSSRVKFNAVTVSKMKKISLRLEDIMKRKDVLDLSERQVKEERATLPTTSLVNEAQVHGREKDHKAILELMRVEVGDGGISVIPIVGMGGVGKTTLAQLIYNDASTRFDIKAWVSVGEDFDVFAVTKTIAQLDGDEKAQDLNSLQLKLKEKLIGKKFLVVLDDLWSEDYNMWSLFYSPLAAGAPGSRIIITTRNQSVSLMTGTVDGYSLQQLSYDDCLSVFTHHALGRKDFSEHLHLRDAGEEIVRRCNGLPLAAKALGGLLRGAPNRNAWEQVLKNRLWGEKSNILPALRLSYSHLPSHLKRCFGYCAIFPKEYEFCRNDLVSLWLAEGFIQQRSEGNECFDDLIARSFFQQSVNDASIFVMHDIINDLAKSISGEICINLDEEISCRKSFSKVRHSAFNRSQLDIYGRFENLREMKCLRTFLALPVSNWKFWNYCHLSCKVMGVLIPELKHLRVLSISGYKEVELPKSIGSLQHLRYLNLHGAEIKTLPESLSELFSLQVLILKHCARLCNLPKDLFNLINLQCLDIRGTFSLQEMPLHIGRLKKLHMLNKFIVGNVDGRRITELLKIPNLQGQVLITELQNVIDIKDVDCPKMRDKEGVDELILEWTDVFDDFRNEREELQVLTALQPQRNIERLSIKSYGGKIFPSWIGSHSFSNMTFLELSKCHNVSSLPPLGQLPSLKDLSIKEMAEIKEIGMEFYGEVSSCCAVVFPSLETLKFEYMKNWAHWSFSNNDNVKGQVFHKLQILEIRSCPKLVGNLPVQLPALQELYIRSCPLLESLPDVLPSLVKLVTKECKLVVLKSVSNIKSLCILEIKNISGLVSLDRAFLEALVSLQEMRVEKCDELKHLWKDEIDIVRLGCLKRLSISHCEEIVSLVEGEVELFLPNLQVLDIFSCHNLEKLPAQLHILTSLTDLKVGLCPKLVAFPARGLPYSVKHVDITGCHSLVSLPEGILVDKNSYNQPNSRIEELRISRSRCDALMILSNGCFPASLRSLEITNMELQLIGSLQMQNRLSHLTSLILLYCELESFPDSGLTIPTLSFFEMLYCKNLKCLPNHMDNHPSLRHIRLHDCPEIVSFPEGGLPPNLTQLSISGCNKLDRQPLSDWRLNALTSLQKLDIRGGMEMVSSLPGYSLLLPTSLTDLKIQQFQSLKSISSEIQKLTSLQRLSIGDCPQLQYLPREGFPPSLGYLMIAGCPLLEKQCRKGTGVYWQLVAAIPLISVR